MGLLAVAIVLPLIAFGFPGGNSSRGEVFLEPADAVGADPFTDLLLRAVPDISSNLDPVASTGEVAGISVQRGDLPGLYGGSRDDVRCDLDLLIAFLGEHPDQAAAWAQVHGITAAEIPDFAGRLTPVLLRQDLRVTNHGFTNGVATPRQSVLQAGSAVLVDETGVPRARCACGNPLLEPTAITGGVEYTGDPWETFSPDGLRATTAGSLQEAFILEDPASGEFFERPVGSDGGDDRELGADVTNVEPRNEPPDESASDIEVPDLTGRALPDAEAELRSLQIVFRIEEVSSEEPAGEVVSVDPPPGTLISPDQEIVLSVSAGPGEEPELEPAPEPELKPDPAPVVVPDVVGTDESSARSALVSARLVAIVVDEQRRRRPPRQGLDTQ